MALGSRTIQKFVREALVTKTPMSVDRKQLAHLKQRLQTELAQFDEMHFRWLDQTIQGKVMQRHLCDFSIRHPQYSYHYYGGFSLVLDSEDALYLQSIGIRSPVGNEDELFEFIRLCRERAVRMKGQHAKRTKVRSLRTAAIVAQIQQLARKYRFDYAIHEGGVKLNLDIRFDGQHVIELSIPYVRFQEYLAPIEAALPVLRDLARANVTTSVRPRMGKYSLRRQKWVLYQTLDKGSQTAPTAPEE